MAKRADNALSEDLGSRFVERHTMHADVYGRLKHAIMSGRVKPGQLLSHRALAAALGTSVMPVRDAVRRLVAERALEVYPNRTIGLPVHTREQFEEICRIRCTLEGLAARHAAVRIGAAGLKELRRLAREMDASEDYATYMQANQAFHFLIYGAAEMPLLSAIIEMLWLQIGPVFNYLGGSTGTHRLPDRHREIIAALGDRDGEGAARALEADITEAYARLEPMFDQGPAAAQG
jgi:DNA-binding GntR family transcriptional regulator